MNDTKMMKLVDEGVEVDRQIRELTNRRKEIKDALVTEAASREDELQATEGGGKSLRFVGADRCAANVVFPAPSLKGKIAGVGKTIEKIMQVAGKHFPQLFTQVPAWKPCAAFRESVEGLLPKPEARRLIKLCEVDSEPSVSFETKAVES